MTTPADLEASSRRPSWRARALGWLAWCALRLQAATWRLRCEGLSELDERLAKGEKLIVIFWHGKYLPLFALLAGRQACVFTSLSRRGDVISEICRRFGYRVIKIPDRGRDHSLDLMRRALAREQIGAIAIDGPLGPYHAVKRGAIQLASELRHEIVPATAAAKRKRVLEERWDLMEVPRLFTTIQLLVGGSFTVPPGLSPEDVKGWSLDIQQRLEALDREAEERLADQYLRS